MKSWWRGSQKIDGSPPASWLSTTTGLPKCSLAGPPKLGAAATLSATSPVAAAVHATRRLDISSSLDRSQRGPLRRSGQESCCLEGADLPPSVKIDQLWVGLLLQQPSRSRPRRSFRRA